MTRRASRRRPKQQRNSAIFQLPAETLVRIIRLASSPYETLQEFTRPPADMPWDVHKDQPHHSYTGNNIGTGLHLYEAAVIACQVCRRWRDIIKQDPKLHFLLIDVSDCNPKIDCTCREASFFGDEGGTITEEVSDEEGSEIGLTYEERFENRLDMGKRHPTCDILIYMPSVLYYDSQGKSHLKKLPHVLRQCADRLRILSCTMYTWQEDKDPRFENVMIELFKDGAHFPRLELVRFDWEYELDRLGPNGGSLSEISWRCIMQNIRPDSVPNLQMLISLPCPWHYIKEPAFQNLRCMRLFDLGNIMDEHPRVWDMINGCPLLEFVHLCWESIRNHSMPPMPVYPPESATTLHHLPALRIDLCDAIAWPALMNLNLPVLEYLEITLWDTKYKYESITDLLPTLKHFERPIFNMPSLKTLKLWPFNMFVFQLVCASTYPVLESFSSKPPSDDTIYPLNNNRLAIEHVEPVAVDPVEKGLVIPPNLMPSLRHLDLDGNTGFLQWFAGELYLQGQCPRSIERV